MKKYIIISALLLGLLANVLAQDEGFGPSAGDFSGAVLFGRGNFLTSGLDIPSAASTNYYWSVSGSAPNLNIDANSNDASNIVGAELRFFLSGRVALKASGGAILRNTPPRDNIPGIIDPNSPNATWIPYYNAVQQSESVDANFNLGMDLLFPSKKFDRMFPYLGFNVPFMYGRRSQYDPTITLESDGSATITDIGLRHVEIFGFGLQTVAGIDYYVAKGMYMGFELKPVSYIYAFNIKIPAPGLEPLEADTHTFSAFSQIYLKLGFRF